MFWGLTLIPGEPCTKVLDKSVCLSMAALESRQTIGSGFTQVLIQANGVDYILCTLMSGVVFQQYMNVKLSEGEKVTLSVEGTGVVHLTGFTMQSSDGQSEKDQNIFEEDYYGDFDGHLQDEHEYSVKVGDSLREGEGWELAPEVDKLSTTDTPIYTDSAPEEVWPNHSEDTIMITPPQPNISPQPSESLNLQEGSVPGVAVSRGDALNMGVQNPSHVTAPSEGDWGRVTGTSTNAPGFFAPRRPLRTKTQSDAGDEDIEARRRRWRLAKREQRKKNRLKALMAQGTVSKPSGQGHLKVGKKYFTPSGRYRSLPTSREPMVDSGLRRYRRSGDNHSQDGPNTSDGPQQGQRLKKEMT